MPLRLKSLELHGYKTFAASARFEFAEGITAIVGPNGSGKSNIADAIRWVLGEQSHNLLRAKKTEDMIFAGSELRPRSGMASATVTFDNADGWLPVDFSEVAITRRAYRDGHNEYLLNGQQVRLKDIFELLAQSGLSERTYTILGQGLVDASLALKADERRRLFEEAAGIGLYRTRREEALRRLDATKRNLERALDILAELEPRVKSLERQARRSMEYAQVQADLRVLLKDWYGYHWHHAQQEFGAAREISKEYELKTNQVRNEYQDVRTTVTQARDQLQGLRARLTSWHRDASQAHEQRNLISRELAVRDERSRSQTETRQSLITEQSALAQQIDLEMEKAGTAEKELTRFLAEYEEAKNQVNAASTMLETRQRERSALENELSATRSDLENLTNHRAGLTARLDEMRTRLVGQKEKFSALAQTVGTSQEQFSTAEKKFQVLFRSRQQAEEQERKAFEDVQQNRILLDALEETLKEQQAKLSAVQAERAGLQAQLGVLEQAEHSLAGYAEGARMLLEAARTSKLSGTRGALSASLDVPVEYELAIAAALGEYTDAVLLGSEKETDEALGLLEANSTGRASLLPLNWLSPQESGKTSEHPDCVGIASSLVKVPADLRPAVDVLLGQVLIVRDRKTARTILAGMPQGTRVVTLKGEVFHKSGQILAGRPALVAALSRPRQRRELNGAITRNDEISSKYKGELGRTNSELTSARDRLESCQHEQVKIYAQTEALKADEQQAKIQAESARNQVEIQAALRVSLVSEITKAEMEEKETAAALLSTTTDLEKWNDVIREKSAALAGLPLDEVQTNTAYWNTQLAVVENTVREARSRHADRLQIAEGIKKQAELLKQRITASEAQLQALVTEKEAFHRQETELNTRLDQLQILIDPAEKELEQAEKLETEQQTRELESQQILAKVERQYNQFQMDVMRKQEALDLLRQKIEDDFGLVNFEYETDVSGPVPLPFEGMVEQLTALAELPEDLEVNMTRQRALLRRMGPVNPEAQNEYEAVKQRHEFMKEQMEDLHAAGSDLQKVIAELDELTKTAFFKTFSSVAEEFRDIFQRLFGGGSARLLLTDPENLSETGIDIEARLPGRREQGLSLLSGGERSLTAIALVFALLKVSPTPVCVMDEVDAMLDEANVGRFRDLLLDLSRATQFVIITHNRNTVQAADVIYGVTMGRDSASQVVSLRLDELSDDYLK